jgi:hypothetical protein
MMSDLAKNESGGAKDDNRPDKPMMRLLQFDVLLKAEKLLVEKASMLQSIEMAFARLQENRSAEHAALLLATTEKWICDVDSENYPTLWKVYWDTARVLTMGAKKYSADNWKKVEPWRYEDAFLRHYAEWMMGETHDPESGISHLGHLMCNAMFLASLYKENK